eukprot:9444109-Pyramimonas_sp.AAC.2
MGSSYLLCLTTLLVYLSAAQPVQYSKAVFENCVGKLCGEPTEYRSHKGCLVLGCVCRVVQHEHSTASLRCASRPHDA